MLRALRRRNERPVCVACGRPIAHGAPQVRLPGGRAHEACAYGRFTGRRREVETK